ncbi:MAG: UDP-N-acetylmuramate--L-alanine ligase, partial [Candidatus Krumholzibacteria bacterium]|nr:UDP-N-acetylmuramate--L-alanine ligase [Candidatus Krumholzibacteria bacterium]
KGSEAGVLVVDDYGHHPTEIAATVKAALDNYDRRLYVMFQPHRYSRTQAMADAFATCFDGAEAVLVTDIYPAGEKPIPGVTAQTIIDRIEATGRVDVRYAKSFENMTDEIAARVRDGDMVITMGAGDIYKAGDMLLKKLKSPAGSKRSNRKQHKR